MTPADPSPPRAPAPPPAAGPQPAARVGSLAAIPGPRAPIAVQSVLFSTARHRLLAPLHRHYGPVVRLRLFPERDVVSLASPADIREVFAGAASTYHAGEGNVVLRPVLGAHSVLTTDEVEHHRLRKLLLPPFSGSALRGYRGMIAALSAEEASSWPAGRPVALHPHMQRLTLDIILRVVLGVTGGARLDELRRTLRAVVDIGALDVFGWHSRTMQRFGRWRRNRQHRDRADKLLRAEITQRRGAADLAERSDVLSRLLTVEVDGDSLSDGELRDQLVTLLLAGHETTATALAWALHELARCPQVRARAERAADDGQDDYLEAVVKEALRKHPVISEVARKLTEPVELGGYRIPAGATVMPAIGVVHSDAQAYPDPELFCPERFLGSSAAAEPPPGTWLPFGGGARRCLGAGFAQMEAVEILRAVLRRYTVGAGQARTEPVRPRHITRAPARGARVVLHPR